MHSHIKLFATAQFLHFRLFFAALTSALRKEGTALETAQLTAQVGMLPWEEKRQHNQSEMASCLEVVKVEQLEAEAAGVTGVRHEAHEVAQVFHAHDAARLGHRRVRRALYQTVSATPRNFS